jgi:hypothetical protein
VTVLPPGLGNLREDDFSLCGSRELLEVCPIKYYFQCPGCGNDDEFFLLEEQSAGLTYGLLLLGDVLAALLYADATRCRVQCAHCRYIFRRPSLPRTSLSTLATWIIGIIVAFGVLTVLLIGAPELANLLPSSPTLQAAERFISENPKAVLFGLLPMIAALLLVSLVASWASNHAAHANLRKQFQTKPKPYVEPKQTPPTSS